MTEYDRLSEEALPRIEIMKNLCQLGERRRRRRRWGGTWNNIPPIFRFIGFFGLRRQSQICSKKHKGLNVFF